MTLYDKLKKLQSVHSVNYWSHRIYAELCYMACLSSTKENKYDARLDEACDYLIAKLAENHSIIKPDAEYVENMLSDLSSDAKSLTVYCIAHAHIDMNWMWGYQETASITVDTFRTMLNLMKEYPEFTFAQSQASTYNIVEKFAPEMLPEIKKYVHEGRWEVSASAWTETDKNMPSGESLSRHILYTKRYLGNLLEIDPDSIDIDFSPDTFGHSANLPEICANGGIKYYYHMRAREEQTDIYRWQSKSGAEVLVFRDNNYNGDVGIRSFEDIPLFCKKNNTDAHLRVYGVGDHGGGPSRRDIEQILDERTFPLYPTIKFGTYKQFFSHIEKQKENFPIRDKEINFVFTGCYTTQTRIKLANRILEDRTYDSEQFAAAACLLADAPKRTAQFESSWRRTLFNHFHDIIPGSGIIETREYAMGNFQEALAGINIAANSAMREIADNIDTTAIPFVDEKFASAEGGGVGYGVSHELGHQFPQTERGRGSVRAIHLFNSTVYDRDEITEITVWDYNYDLSRAYFTDSDGNEIEFELIEGGHGYWGHNFTRFYIRAKVKAFGYATYILKLREYDSVNSLASTYVTPWKDEFGDNDIVLENDKLKAVFDCTTMAMVRLTDKSTGEDIVTPDRPSALFRYAKENPIHGMTAWRVGPYMNIDVLNSSAHTVRMLGHRINSQTSSVQYEILFASSKLNVTAELKKGDSYINFRIDVDWSEVGNGTCLPQLNFALPVKYIATDYIYDVPMGVQSRGDLAYDVPGNSFIRINRDEDMAAYIVSDSKYGFRGHDDMGAVTLIRSSIDPDQYPDRGIHHINLAVGVCPKADMKMTAVKYAHPIAFNAGTKHSGKLPMNGSLGIIADKNDTLMVSSVKNAEDDGYIIRVCDFGGKTEKAKIVLSDIVPAPKKAELVDITERHVFAECELSGREITFPIKPYGIATVRIK